MWQVAHAEQQKTVLAKWKKSFENLFWISCRFHRFTLFECVLHVYLFASFFHLFASVWQSRVTGFVFKWSTSTISLCTVDEKIVLEARICLRSNETFPIHFAHITIIVRVYIFFYRLLPAQILLALMMPLDSVFCFLTLLCSAHKAYIQSLYFECANIDFNAHWMKQMVDAGGMVKAIVKLHVVWNKTHGSSGVKKEFACTFKGKLTNFQALSCVCASNVEKMLRSLHCIKLLMPFNWANSIEWL